MTPEQFVYWLQGYAEMTVDKAPSEAQWRMINDHLKIVFNKVTPNRIDFGNGLQVMC